jgi:hypothetical protein
MSPDPAGLKLLSDSVRVSEHLRFLLLCAGDVVPLSPAPGHVPRGREQAWTAQSSASLVACLRTNVVLEALQFFLRASDVPDPTIFFQLEDLLSTYNFTL